MPKGKLPTVTNVTQQQKQKGKKKNKQGLEIQECSSTKFNIKKKKPRVNMQMKGILCMSSKHAIIL